MTGVDPVADLSPEDLIHRVARLAELVRDGATAETAVELGLAASLLRDLERATDRDRYIDPAAGWRPWVTWLTWTGPAEPGWTQTDTVRTQTAAAGGYLIATAGQMRSIYGGQAHTLRECLAMQSLAALPRYTMPTDDSAPVLLYATNGGGATTSLLSAVGRRDRQEYPGAREPTAATVIQTLIRRVVHHLPDPWE